MEIEFDEEVRENNLLDDIKNHKKAIIIISAVLVFIMLICYGCYKTMLPTDWHHFNSERIAFVEEKYKISLDNAKPERYWVVSIAPDGDSSFTFEVDDYKKFMENDFHGMYFLYGIVGLAMIIVYLGFFAIRALIRIFRDPKTYLTLPICAYSTSALILVINAYFSASVLRRPNASVYLSVALAMLWLLTESTSPANGKEQV